MDRRPLRSVQHAIMNSGVIGGGANYAVECIYLTHQVTLADATDCRIARHRSNCILVHRDKCDLGTPARRRVSCLATSVPATHDYYVKRHSYQRRKSVPRETLFADAKLCK